MRVLFVYPDLEMDTLHFSAGVGSLAAVLKAGGHDVRLVYLSEQRDVDLLLDTVRTWNPGMVAFSAMTTMFARVKRILPLLRRNYDGLIVCGGVHPTVEPECLVDTPELDALCRGEGEYPLLELADRLERGTDFTDLRNFWFRQGDRIVKNDLGPLVEDLDELPEPDREVFDYEAMVSPERSAVRGFPGMRTGDFIFSRGCPFNCTYCSNHTLRRIYPGKYVRLRGVDKALAEIARVVDRYRLQALVLHDDTITLDKRWLYPFLEGYGAKLRLPFTCNTRVDSCDRETFQRLRDAGCTTVAMGIESGNETVRRAVLGRKISDEQIVRAFTLAHDAGLSTFSFNMIGIPGETPASFLDTVRLNSRIQPNYSGLYVYHPYPGTDLGDRCRREGLIAGEPEHFRERSATVLRLPGFPAKDVDYYFRNFQKLLEYECSPRPRRLLNRGRQVAPSSWLHPATAVFYGLWDWKGFLAARRALRVVGRLMWAVARGRRPLAGAAQRDTRGRG